MYIGSNTLQIDSVSDKKKIRLNEIRIAESQNKISNQSIEKLK